MICQNCNHNEANVKYTQIINGVKKQMSLCEKCAKELGIDNISFDMQMDFSNFFGDMFNDFEGSFISSLTNKQELLCDKCKNTYDDFIKNGKFSCDRCYETFENKIDPLLKNIHGANTHIGRNVKVNKIQGKSNIQDEKNEIKEDKNNEKEEKIKELQERLKKEIREERYEDAAKTRDEIKRIK